MLTMMTELINALAEQFGQLDINPEQIQQFFGIAQIQDQHVRGNQIQINQTGTRLLRIFELINQGYTRIVVNNDFTIGETDMESPTDVGNLVFIHNPTTGHVVFLFHEDNNRTIHREFTYPQDPLLQANVRRVFNNYPPFFEFTTHIYPTGRGILGGVTAATIGFSRACASTFFRA
jgi:hypothetical protein